MTTTGLKRWRYDLHPKFPHQDWGRRGWNKLYHAIVDYRVVWQRLFAALQGMVSTSLHSEKRTCIKILLQSEVVPDLPLCPLMRSWNCWPLKHCRGELAW